MTGDTPRIKAALDAFDQAMRKCQTWRHAVRAALAAADAVPQPEAAAPAWGDKADEWSTRITAAHPMETDDHDTYMVAMQMVGNRHSKAALVELVNWLLKGKP